MKKYLASAAVIGISLVAFPQSDTAAHFIGATCYADLSETTYTCHIKREFIFGGPTWDPAKPLPMTFQQAERYLAEHSAHRCGGAHGHRPYGIMIEPLRL